MALWQDLPTARFQLAYIDWPWRWMTRSDKGDGRAPPYPRLKLADMKTFPLPDLLTRNAAVAMWTIDSHTEQMFELAAHFGLRYSTKAFCWVKRTDISGNFPIGTGKVTRANPEDCFLFWYGKGLPIRDHGVPRLILAPRREHSRKPDEARDRLVKLFGAVDRLELFARDRDPRFTAWGNELPPACDHRDWLFARDGRGCPKCGAMIVDMGD